MDMIVYWDSEDGCQKERECTEAEQAEIDARRGAGISSDEYNAPVLVALQAIDAKTPRAVREALISGDTTRVQALEAEAEQFRLQLRKD